MNNDPRDNIRKSSENHFWGEPMDNKIDRIVKEYGGTLKALGVDSEAESIIRADERAKIRAWASREAEDVGIDLYRADLLKFLDSLDSPSKGEKE